MVSNTTFGVVIAVIGILVGAFVFRAVVVPGFIYVYNYYFYGQKKAEDAALDSMGENKASYMLKGMLAAPQRGARAEGKGR